MLLASHLSAEQLVESRRSGGAVRGKDLPAVPPFVAGGARGQRQRLCGHSQRGTHPHGLGADGGDGS